MPYCVPQTEGIPLCCVNHKYIKFITPLIFDAQKLNEDQSNKLFLLHPVQSYKAKKTFSVFSSSKY